MFGGAPDRFNSLPIQQFNNLTVQLSSDKKTIYFELTDERVILISNKS